MVPVKYTKDISFLWETEFDNSFAGRRVLVTGATGFVGSHLCDALVALGAEVYGVSRSACSENIVPGCKPWAADLSDNASAENAISQLKPELVYHLAGLVNTKQEIEQVLPTLRGNLLSTIHLLMAVTVHGCERMVIAGSSEEPSAGHLGEMPTSPYAAAKEASTAYAMMFHFLYQTPVVIARPFMSYGPRQPLAKLIPYTITSLLRNETPQLSSGQRVCDLIYIPDLIRGLLRAGIQDSLIGKTVDLGTGKGTLIREVVERLVQLTGSVSRPAFGALQDRRGERPQVADIRKTQLLLGWQPYWSLQEGLVETVAWYQSRLNYGAH